MRTLIIAFLTTIAATSVWSSARRVPEWCYVAEVGLIIDGGSDYRFHRVVVAGIRKVEPAPEAAPDNCEPRNALVTSVLRRAVEQHLDSVNVTPPRTRSIVEVRHESLDVVRNEIARFAARAHDHAGTFRRVEVVRVDIPTSRSEELALPRLIANPADAATCASDNTRLATAGAAYRWAC